MVGKKYQEKKNQKQVGKLKRYGKYATPVVAMALAVNMLSPMSLAVEEYKKGNVEKDVIIMYKNDEGKELVLDKAIKVEKELENVQVVKSTMKVRDMEKLERDNNVLVVEEDVKFKLLGAQDLQVISSSSSLSTISKEESYWNIQTMNAPTAWAEGYTGKGVKIAVIDSGADMDHPDLNLAGGVTMVEGQDSYEDYNGHGTNVAGIISAKRNGSGVVGIAPDAEVYAVKAMDDKGYIALSDVVEGIDWAIENDMDIVNMSIAIPFKSQILGESMKKAHDEGLVLVAGAGNSGTPSGTGDTVEYPAGYDEVIAVSAIDQSKERAIFSSTGNQVEFTAPGTDVISTYLNGKYAISSGTSQATPHVTGLIALLMEKYPHYSNEEIRAELMKLAEDLGDEGRDAWYGYGLVSYQSMNQKLIKEDKIIDEKVVEEEPIQKKPVVEEKITEKESVDNTPVDNKYQIKIDKKPVVKKEPQAPVQSPKDEGSQKALIERAEKSVMTALKKRSYESLVEAQQLIDQIENQKEKQKLQKRLDTIIKSVEQYAEKAVSRFELVKSKSAYEQAVSLVENVVDDEVKEALQKRIDAVLNEMVQDANQKVESYEKNKTLGNYLKARNAINNIPSSQVKNELLERLED